MKKEALAQETLFVNYFGPKALKKKRLKKGKMYPALVIAYVLLHLKQQ